MTVRRIAIVGLGLIGGSLGLALKQAKGSELEVVGFSRRLETAAEALRRGMVDRAETHLDVAVSHADIVIIATPVLTMKDIFREIAGYLSPDSIVTDTGSTKAQVMKWAQEYLPPTVSFVGGHPMTGKETSGLGEAEARLLKDCVYCLTPAQSRAKSQESRVGGRGTPDSRLRTPDSTEVSRSMERLVKSVGARPLFIDAEMHDELVAGVSHLPILLSSALVSALARSPLWPQMSKLAATGYRDSTRLASGSPELNCGICLTNQSAIINWIDRYIEELKGFRRLVLEGAPRLEESLRDARGIRQRWLENEGRRFNSQESRVRNPESGGEGGTNDSRL